MKYVILSAFVATILFTSCKGFLGNGNCDSTCQDSIVVDSTLLTDSVSADSISGVSADTLTTIR